MNSCCTLQKNIINKTYDSVITVKRIEDICYDVHIENFNSVKFILDKSFDCYEKDLYVRKYYFILFNFFDNFKMDTRTKTEFEKLLTTLMKLKNILELHDMFILYKDLHCHLINSVKYYLKNYFV